MTYDYVIVTLVYIAKSKQLHVHKRDKNMTTAFVQITNGPQAPVCNV